MYKYILKRLAMLIPVLIGTTLIVYCIMDLTPGDPARMILAETKTSEENIEKMRESLGLNDPLLVRYVRYITNLLKGDWGISYKNKISVLDQIKEKLPNTILLAFSGMVVAIIIGIPIGIISAKKQYTLFDNVSMIGALIGTSAPAFWLGLLLVIVFSLKLKWLPPAGMGQGLVMKFRSLILPALTIGTGTAAIITRMTRSSMLETMRQDYIDTARSKGVKESIVTTSHMLKNALIPIITVVGLQFGSLLGGSVMTENVFSWPGLGRFVVESIKTKDIPCVLGSVVALCILFSIVNLGVDILYAFVDPRIKSQYKTNRRKLI